MISSKIFAYISTINLFIAILGFVKTQNYWYIPPVGICLFVCIVWSIIEYKISKKEKVRIAIHRENGNHYCNVLTSNVICFERPDGLWVKEYCRFEIPEGRTYMVYYCPWCGYQNEKSKSHEKANMYHKMQEIMNEKLTSTS